MESDKYRERWSLLKTSKKSLTDLSTEWVIPSRSVCNEWEVTDSSGHGTEWGATKYWLAGIALSEGGIKYWSVGNSHVTIQILYWGIGIGWYCYWSVLVLVLGFTRNQVRTSWLFWDFTSKTSKISKASKTQKTQFSSQIH